MGTNLDPIPEPAAEHAEPVTWIGRDRPSLERVLPAEAPPAAATARPRNNQRLLWVIGALVAVALILLAAAKIFGGHKRPGTTLEERAAPPLVTVIIPKQQAVTSSVSFTGTIAARYDMPIANEGDTGRIIAVYAEAGDKVKR
ncbi:MAG TPA: hypothetical protein VL994_10650, partial [Steroidobacteraceae bacterium]|nr:hypothetical protein [Steroidobacteraceae bacterium]